MSAMEKLDKNAIERLRHWMGERLSSRDLNAQLGHEASLRWWHNRALHAAYGVAEGLEVKTETVGGEQVAKVAPGLAFDGFGREIELRETAEIKLPPREPAEPLGWVLLLMVAASRRGAPRLRWIPARVAPGCAGVPIASGGYGQSQVFDLFTASGKAFRFTTPRTRALARPKVEVGATVQGRTDWRAWGYPPVAEVEQDDDDVDLTLLAGPGARGFLAGGIEVEIDTSAGGFTDTPCTFAWLHGDPWERAGHGTVPVPLARIVRETPTAFVFQVWAAELLGKPLVEAAGGGEETRSEAFASLLALARSELYVCWLGIEPHVHTASASNGGNHHGIA